MTTFTESAVEQTALARPQGAGWPPDGFQSADL
jgi:hypothetical protein